MRQLSAFPGNHKSCKIAVDVFKLTRGRGNANIPVRVDDDQRHSMGQFRTFGILHHLGFA